MRILRLGLVSLATAGLMIGSLSGLSGCGGKPSDGTMVEGAAPQTDEQKAIHKKYYDRSKRGKAAGKR